MALPVRGQQSQSQIGWSSSLDRLRECQDAIKKGDKDLFVSLLAGLEIDALGKNGFNVLHFATCYGRLEIAQVILEDYQADVHAPTMKGNTALHIACFEGFCDMVWNSKDCLAASVILADLACCADRSTFTKRGIL